MKSSLIARVSLFFVFLRSFSVFAADYRYLVLFELLGAWLSGSISTQALEEGCVELHCCIERARSRASRTQTAMDSARLLDLEHFDFEDQRRVGQNCKETKVG